MQTNLLLHVIVLLPPSGYHKKDQPNIICPLNKRKSRAYGTTFPTIGCLSGVFGVRVHLPRIQIRLSAFHLPPYFYPCYSLLHFFTTFLILLLYCDSSLRFLTLLLAAPFPKTLVLLVNPWRFLRQNRAKHGQNQHVQHRKRLNGGH